MGVRKLRISFFSAIALKDLWIRLDAPFSFYSAFLKSRVIFLPVISFYVCVLSFTVLEYPIHFIIWMFLMHLSVFKYCLNKVFGALFRDSSDLSRKSPTHDTPKYICDSCKSKASKTLPCKYSTLLWGANFSQLLQELY